MVYSLINCFVYFLRNVAERLAHLAGLSIFLVGRVQRA